MKRIASTSRLAFRELQPELQPRESEVLDALQGASMRPTAYELLERMRSAHPGFDVNSIRPRLTSLRDRGLIVGVDKRRCSVTGRIAWTWNAVSGTAGTVNADEGPATRERPRRAQGVFDLGWGQR